MATLHSSGIMLRTATARHALKPNLSARIGRPACPATLSTAAALRQCAPEPQISEPLTPSEISDLLSEPDWDVQELMPTERDIESSADVTPAQLRHLLRLSALPPPASPAAEQKMLRDLRAQLHFVKQIQKIDTAGVEPLVALRDETAAAQKEEEIGLEAMRDALAGEEVVGRYHKRIRRKELPPSRETQEAEDWDVLGQAPKRAGRFFVVDGREG